MQQRGAAGVVTVDSDTDAAAAAAAVEESPFAQMQPQPGSGVAPLQDTQEGPTAAGIDLNYRLSNLGDSAAISASAELDSHGSDPRQVAP